MKENYVYYGLEEGLEDIRASLDCVCELLEKILVKIVVKEEEMEKEVKEAKEEAGFRLAKIGADIGEPQEKGQMDVIARIFGNEPPRG